MSTKDSIGMPVILLTSCIDPSLSKNRWHTLNDVDLRLRQYIDAVCYYGKETDLKICFVDNSGYDISHMPAIEEYITTGRLEILTYLASEDVRSRGKGYGEQDILRYALKNSKNLLHADYIIKATGRIKIRNIKSLIRLTEYLSKKREKYVIGEKLYKAKWMQSYLFIAHHEFFGEAFFAQMRKVSEKNEDMKMFEEGLYSAIEEWKTSGGKFLNVLTPIIVDGMRGEGGYYCTNSFKDKIKCLLNAFRCNLLNKL